MSDNKNNEFDENTLNLDEDINDYFVTLNLEEGDVECQVMSIFEADGKDYIALLPLDDKGNPGDEFYIYGYKEDKDGNPDLIYIDDEDEYEAAVDAFDEILDDQMFDEDD